MVNLVCSHLYRHRLLSSASLVLTVLSTHPPSATASVSSSAKADSSLISAKMASSASSFVAAPVAASDPRSARSGAATFSASVTWAESRPSGTAAANVPLTDRVLVFWAVVIPSTSETTIPLQWVALAEDSTRTLAAKNSTKTPMAGDPTEMRYSSQNRRCPLRIQRSSSRDLATTWRRLPSRKSSPGWWPGIISSSEHPHCGFRRLCSWLRGWRRRSSHLHRIQCALG